MAPVSVVGDIEAAYKEAVVLELDIFEAVESERCRLAGYLRADPSCCSRFRIDRCENVEGTPYTYISYMVLIEGMTRAGTKLTRSYIPIIPGADILAVRSWSRP